MKTRTTLAALALLLGMLCACSTPGSAASDPFRTAQGFGMQGQMAAHQQASAMMAGRSPRRLAGMQVPPMPAFQPYAYAR